MHFADAEQEAVASETVDLTLKGVGESFQHQEELHCPWVAAVTPSSDLPPAEGFNQCLRVVETMYGDDPPRSAALTRALMHSYLKKIPTPAASQVAFNSESTGAGQPPLSADGSQAGAAGCDEEAAACPPRCSPEEDLSDIIGSPEPSWPGMDDAADGDWQLEERYELGRILGTGVYGEVRVAWDRREKRPVAIKRMNDFWQSSGDCKRILREVAILSRLHHSHTVQIYDLPLPPDLQNFTDLYIVMELCDASLLEVCKNRKGLSLPQARKLIYGMLLGCSYLHSAGIYHRDLKPGNCVVNRDCSVKICDFNLSRVVDAGQSDARAITRALTGFVCTPWYRAPEIALALGYSDAVDVWSAGCIVAEIFSALNEQGREPQHRPLFAGPSGGFQPAGVEGRPSKRDQLNVIFDVIGTPSRAEEAKLPKTALQRLGRYERRKGGGLRARVPHEAGEEGYRLIEQMIRFLPQRRITMVNALRHAFFDGVTRSPDEQHLESEHIDIGFAEDAIRMGQEVDEDLHAQVRQRLLAEIRKFHPGGLAGRQKLPLDPDESE